MHYFQEQVKQHVWHPFTPMRLWQDDEPLVIERGKGIYLYDVEGREYIDGVSSLWCNVHGHCHEHIDEAIRRQLSKIAHSTLLGLASVPSIELAGRLIELAPQGLEKVFYSDSGATAVEIALKMAFQYWQNLKQSKKECFISLKQSYHGDTIGAISVSGISTFHEIFGKLTFRAKFSDNPDPYRFAGTADQCREHCISQMAELLGRYGPEVAAVIVEPLVQGAGGIIVHPEGFLAGVRQLTREHNVLLIADEVATGFGRTGTMFACEQEKLAPDIMCLGKGITAGYMPLAATLVSGEIFEAFLKEPWLATTFYHGHTYTGNALACAAGRANLEVFEQEKTLEAMPAKIALIGRYLEKISHLDFVGNVRQKGMMAGVELVEDKESKRGFDPNWRIGAKLCQTMLKKGVILRPLGNVLVIMPPLAIKIEQLEHLLQVVTESIEHELKQLIAT